MRKEGPNSLPVSLGATLELRNEAFGSAGTYESVVIKQRRWSWRTELGGVWRRSYSCGEGGGRLAVGRSPNSAAKVPPGFQLPRTPLTSK
jgi:hypothetical protein